MKFRRETKIRLKYEIEIFKNLKIQIFEFILELYFTIQKHIVLMKSK